MLTAAARAVGLLAVFVLALVSGVTPAFAGFTPPPFTSPVVDTAGKLSEAERRALDERLERFEKATTHQIAVLVTSSLEGESIEDVSYRTARAWGVGKKGKDNGVLVVLAPTERKVRIETGKGVGGELTDIASSHIIRDTIAPRLKVEQFYRAISEAIDAIMSALGGPVFGETAMPAGLVAPASAATPVAPRPADTRAADARRAARLAEDERVAAASRFEWITGGALAFIVLAVGLFVVLRMRRYQHGSFGEGASSSGSSSGSSPFSSSSASSGSTSFGSSSSSSSSSSGGFSGGGGGDFGGGGASGDY